jgi:hypothetical protein
MKITINVETDAAQDFWAKYSWHLQDGDESCSGTGCGRDERMALSRAYREAHGAMHAILDARFRAAAKAEGAK